MKDIDFFKECCAIAYGFKYCIVGGHDSLRLVYQEYSSFVNFIGLLISPIYPMLLQRATEGVNHLWVFQILQPSRGIFTVNNGDGDLLEEFYFNASDPDDILKSKREALEYVFKQMKGNKPL